MTIGKLLSLREASNGSLCATRTQNARQTIRRASWRLDDGQAPACVGAADLNDSGGLDVSDAIYGLNYLFADGPSPAAPFPDCGPDPTPDTLACDSYPPCP